MQFFQLHELNVREGGNKLPAQLAYLVLILNASFEECRSILTIIFSKLMEVTKHIRHILLCEVNKSNNATWGKCEEY